MASRRCVQSLHRHYSSLFSSSKTLSQNLKTSLHTLTTPSLQQLENPTSNLPLIRPNLQPHFESFSSQSRNRGPHDDEEEEEDDDDDEEDEDEDDEEDHLSECSEGEDDDGVPRPNGVGSRTYSVEEIAEEAAAIGYKVIGPLDPTERPFKHREPYFAVVQIGSHQFKVSNGDSIYTERLKFCEVNDKLILSKVLMVGSKSQTIIGRPILPDATVHAVVEEHALDAKVIIFKKKRRKNYRRTKGHRQELTRLRITDIEGIEKPEKLAKPEKVEIAA